MYTIRSEITNHSKEVQSPRNNKKYSQLTSLAYTAKHHQSDRQTHTQTNPLISESLALETHHSIPGLVQLQTPDTEILVRSPDAAPTGRAFWHDNILINENDQLIYCHNLR